MLTATTRKRSAFPVPALPLLGETMHKDEHIYEWGKSLIGLDVTMSDMGKATGVQVISHDQIKSEDFVGECKLEDVKLKIGGTNDWRSVYAGVVRQSIRTVIDPNIIDRTEAEEVAEALMREMSFDFIKGNGEAEGDAGLKAGAVVTIKYAGLRYDGEYIAEEVEHKLSMKGGYTTEFDIRRNMIGDEAVEALGGSRAVGPSHAPPPREKPESEQITVYEEEKTEEDHEPLLKEILSVTCYDRDGNETTKYFEDQPLTVEAAVNASVEDGETVTFGIYPEGASPGQDEPVETLTANVRQNRAQVELDAETMGRVIGGVIGGAVAGPLGARAGRAVGGRIGRFFVRASSDGCEEVRSECVEIEPTMEEHNRNLVATVRASPANHLTITDFIENGRLTSPFDEPQKAVGNWRVTAHNGVDGVGGFAKTPFYTRLYEIVDGRASNPITLEIIGTPFRMQIIHGDRGPVRALTVGAIFSPGQEILPFPRYNNGAGSDPHFHFQIAENRAHFVSPLTLDPSERGTRFQFSEDGGAEGSWTDFNLGF